VHGPARFTQPQPPLALHFPTRSIVYNCSSCDLIALVPTKALYLTLQHDLRLLSISFGQLCGCSVSAARKIRHQDTPQNLQVSADRGCRICLILRNHPIAEGGSVFESHRFSEASNESTTATEMNEPSMESFSALDIAASEQFWDIFSFSFDTMALQCPFPMPASALRRNR